MSLTSASATTAGGISSGASGSSSRGTSSGKGSTMRVRVRLHRRRRLRELRRQRRRWRCRFRRQTRLCRPPCTAMSHPCAVCSPRWTMGARCASSAGAASSTSKQLTGKGRRPRRLRASLSPPAEAWWWEARAPVCDGRVTSATRHRELPTTGKGVIHRHAMHAKDSAEAHGPTAPLVRIRHPPLVHQARRIAAAVRAAHFLRRGHPVAYQPRADLRLERPPTRRRRDR